MSRRSFCCSLDKTGDRKSIFWVAFSMILAMFSIILEPVSWSYNASPEVAASLLSTEAIAGILIGGNRLRLTCTNMPKQPSHLSV